MDRTEEFNLELASQFTKKNCRHCHGRGYRVVEHANGQPIRLYIPFVRYVDYCSCVKNNIKKAEKHAVFTS